MPKRDPIAGLDGLYFAAKQLVDGLYTGRHASPLRGSGIEFHDYRPYTPGDDLRSIDWKRYGRTDRYYLKRYRRETDLNLHVMVDGSASMDFAGLKGKPQANQATKFAVAQQLAAALTTLSIRQGDRAALGVFDKRLRCLHPPTGSLRQLQIMLADLEQAEPASGQADLAGSLEQLAHTLRGHKAAIAVVSDLLDETEPMLDVFDRLRFAGHEIVVFQVLTPDERALPTESRGLRMIDPEAGPAVNTRPQQVAASYQQLIEAHLSTLRRSLAARGMDHVLVDTTEPLIAVLRWYLQQRAARAR
ncbi:MAG: DUF58 domain-containing protein [Phycisphaeraceae bacterium]|nr:DUF58 domain-containing protein [Phycisphaeraceae bacterium]